MTKPINMESISLQNLVDNALDEINQSLEHFKPELTAKEIGVITTLSTGIVKVSGVPGVGFEELLKFPQIKIIGS